MDYRLGIFLRMRWVDPRLAYETTCKKPAKNVVKKPKCQQQNITLTVHPEMMEKIWIPDLFFSDEKE